MPRVSKKVHAWAERLGETMGDAAYVREWWTFAPDDTPEARRARRARGMDERAYLYIDDGEPDLLCITVQRIARPSDG